MSLESLKNMHSPLLLKFLSQWVEENYHNDDTIDSSVLNELYQIVCQKFSFQHHQNQLKQIIKVILSMQQQKKNQKNQVPLLKPFLHQDRGCIIVPKLNIKKINFTSKRKILPSNQAPTLPNPSLQTRLEQLERINNDCIHSLNRYDKKYSKKSSVKQIEGINEQVLWFYHQYFYSNYDRKYFNWAPLRDLIQELGYDSNYWTFKNHLTFIRSLPKPALFKQEFIQRERINLQNFRNRCRQTNKNLSRSNEQIDLPVHSIVLAVHPMCGHLHTGSILAIYKQNLYMVKFMKPDLPTQKILDINMSTQYTTTQSNIRKQDNFQRDKNYALSNQNGLSQVTDSLNFQMTSLLIKILTLKSQLLIYVRTINDNFQQIKKTDAKNDDNQKQIQHWLISYIDKIDFVCKQVLIRFRLRGVNQSNSAAIYGNLRTLLISPLKLMSKQFQNNGDQPDLNAADQIKKIIQKQRQNQLTKTMANIVSSQLEYFLHDQTKKQQMTRLLRSCMGILSDLKYEGKNFDVENNQNLLDLSNTSGQTNAQQFNQIYEKLFSIINKIRD